MLMHLVAYRQRAGRRRRRPRASAAGHRVCRRGHSARPRRAGRGRDDARQHSDRRVRHAVDAGAARTRSRRTSRRTTVCCSPTTARSRSGRTCSARTTRWRRSSTSRRSASWRGMLGREHLLSREEVMRLQGLRGTLRHRVAGADLSRSGAGRPRRAIRSCQVVVAPAAPGERLVPDTSVDGIRRRRLAGRYGRRDSANIRATDGRSSTRPCRRACEGRLGLSQADNGGDAMGEALGMVETKGLVAMIEAADAMVKAAKVDAGRLGEDRRRLRDGDRARRRRGGEGRHRRRRRRRAPRRRARLRARHPAPAREPRRRAADRQGAKVESTAGQRARRPLPAPALP